MRILALALIAGAALAAQDARKKEVDARGDHMMGFSHEKTTHHFLLSKDGGSINVSVNDPNDASSRDQIRMHLQHIAKMFAAGDFNAPMFIHDQVPPGVPVMKKLKNRIAYKYEESDNGARIRMISSNNDAVAAIHDFLKFQITDHQTGDPLMVP
jgi:hypothetical protein